MQDDLRASVGPVQLFDNPHINTDSSVLYSCLVSSMLPRCTRVVDVGCGRGAYADEQESSPSLFDFRSAGREILGLDIDPAASANPFIDRFGLLTDVYKWPVADNSIDLIVSDWTLEHVDDPRAFVAEVVRSLRIGGAFVARTVSARSALALFSRAVPNRRHGSVLRYLQPGRKTQDIFPTRYRMNTPSRLNKLLSDRFTYSLSWRPGVAMYIPPKFETTRRVALAAERHLPGSVQSCLVICARLDRK